MNLTKFIVNQAFETVSPDNDTVGIKTLTEQLCIRGSGISTIFFDVIEQFKNPAYIDNVVTTLSDKYEVSQLKKLINFMLDKKIITDNDLSDLINEYGVDLIEKIFYYTVGGISLREIINDLSALKIGVIGSGQLVNDFEKHGISAVLYNDISHLRPVIDELDFIVACSGLRDYNLFNEINELCYNKGKKWIRIAVDSAKSEVGPLFVPDETCCYSCLQTRSRRNMSDEDVIFDIIPKREKTVELNSLHLLQQISASVACIEAIKHHTGIKCNLLNNVLLIDCTDYRMQKDYIYRDYMCPVCGQRDVISA